MKIFKKITDSVTGIAGKAMDFTKDGVRWMWDSASGSYNFVVEVSQDSIDWIKDLDKLVIKECIVHAYLIPVGYDSNDYALYIDFNEMVGRLRSGILVRPVIQIWSATDKIDRNKLSRLLKENFSKQLQDALDKEKEELEDQRIFHQEKLSKDMAKKGGLINNALSLTIATVIVLLIQGNPVFDAILLLAALLGGKDTLTLLNSYLRQLFSLIFFNKKDDNKLREIEDKIKEKEKSFDEAVGNIEIEVHSKLAYLYKLMCELEQEETSYEQGTITAQDEPDIKSILKVYLQQGDFEEKYEPFIKLVLEEE